MAREHSVAMQVRRDAGSGAAEGGLGAVGGRSTTLSASLVTILGIASVLHPYSN